MRDTKLRSSTRTSPPPPPGPEQSPKDRCPHYPDCVGCTFIGVRYGEQLARKRERVCAALRPYTRLSGLAVPAVVGSQRVFGYRNQAKLVARRGRRGLLLGIYRPRSHQVVDISGCPVHHPQIPIVLSGIRRVAERQNVPIYDERTSNGWLRYIVVRSSAWKKCVQVVPVVRDHGFAGEQKFLAALARISGVRSVVLNINASPGNAVFGESFMPITREASLIDRIGGLDLKSRAGSFLQANLPAARRVYERVVEWADPQPDEVAVDLYCGVGAISFYLAGRARLVLGAEESPLAVLSAKENIRLNGFHNVRFFAGSAAEVLGQQRERVERIDLITLNPPRKGADLPTREAIVASSPSRIVYVSCCPETLARDLDWFAGHGYAVAKLQPFDLLPQTEHVECVALLVANP